MSFAGSERSTVEMRLGEDGAWQPMERLHARDPYYVTMFERQHALIDKLAKMRGADPVTDKAREMVEREFRPFLGRKMSNPDEFDHLWHAPLPANPQAGSRVIEVRTTDMFGQTYTAHRVIRVE